MDRTIANRHALGPVHQCLCNAIALCFPPQDVLVQVVQILVKAKLLVMCVYCMCG